MILEASQHIMDKSHMMMKRSLSVGKVACLLLEVSHLSKDLGIEPVLTRAGPEVS